MNFRTAVGMSLLGCTLIPTVSAGWFSSGVTTYQTFQQNATIYAAPDSTPFIAWAMLFAVFIICLLLSVYIPRYREFCAFIALFLSVACALLIPYIVNVEYATHSVVQNGALIVSVTPIITEMGSLPLMLVMILFVIAAVVNALRSMLVIIQDASVDSRPNDFDQTPADFAPDGDMNARTDTNKTRNVFRKNR